MAEVQDNPITTVCTFTRWKFLCGLPGVYPNEIQAPKRRDVAKISLGEKSINDYDDDIKYLRCLDPKEWKKQDHYAVLGLKEVRYKAKEQDIKRAYRKKVLIHHPDKRRARGEEIRADDDYFVCITKAWEILGSHRSRRSYDSVDPYFDDSIPSANEHSRNSFYTVFGPVFELNSRWSEKSPVPKLGGPETLRTEVEGFYTFWYNFESWREYSYLDEEEKEKGQGREERKWIERQNKANRAKLKKEEMARIRTLVDTAYFLDPRIHKFKQEDKDRKLAVKEARKEAIRIRQEEEERLARIAEEEAQRLKEEEIAREKAKQNALKEERNALKKALRVQRSSLRKLLKANDYYVKKEIERVHLMSSLEKICESFSGQEIENLAIALEERGRDAFIEAIQEVERRIEGEKQTALNEAKRATINEHVRSKGGGAPWTTDDLQLLMRAIRIFPAGTIQRWEAVASFINQHHTGDAETRTAKEVLSKAKDLQNSDFSQNSLKVAINTNASHTLEKSFSFADVGVSLSERSASPTEHASVSSGPWTAQEQQLLEQALKTYPVNTSERWDKIAECIPSRSKKDCVRRCKELAEMVKAKKAAQAAAAASAAERKLK